MKLLLVEDEEDLGIAIKRTLNHNNYSVDWFQNGLEAWEYLNFSQIKYDLAIFDWLLPGLSGIELLKKSRQKSLPIPVLMLTAKDTMADKVTGLDAGADDYLVKPFGMVELLARLRALQRRSPRLEPRQLQLGNLVLNYVTNSIWLVNSEQNKQIIPLTSKEFLLLEYFMRHPNQIVTREQLLNQLWELGTEPISNVVAAQIRLLRRKLAQYQCENLIETIYGLGYRFAIKKDN